MSSNGTERPLWGTEKGQAFTSACLQALAEGDVMAAIVLSDYLQDEQHPYWRAISQMARTVQLATSWLEVLATVQLLREVIMGSEEQADSACTAFERLVHHVG